MSQVIKECPFVKLKRYSVFLISLLLRFKSYKLQISNLISYVIADTYKGKSLLKKKKLVELTSPSLSISLPIFAMRDGNTTYYEQIVLASLIKFYQPKNILEIGTFNGFSTLTFGLNSSEETKITTVDLPSSIRNFSKVLKADLPFIIDKAKEKKLYQQPGVSSKVRQIYADSTQTDFSAFQEENTLFDFIFVDAGHSYDCVKNDTEKALKVLSKQGIILWHDFSPNCRGVFTYLNELSKSYPLIHIEQTNLVFYKKP